MHEASEISELGVLTEKQATFFIWVKQKNKW